MIRTALEFVKQELDAYMVGREPDIYTTGNVVNVAPLMHPDNSSGLDANKHIKLYPFLTLGLCQHPILPF